MDKTTSVSLRKNHFKLLMKNSTEQNGYQFHSSRIAKHLLLRYVTYFLVSNVLRTRTNI